jgi:NitT/TauT family transport system substrate-binding protein
MSGAPAQATIPTSALLTGAAVALLTLTPSLSMAADALRVGESSPGSFDMMPVQIGIAERIFEKHDLTVEVEDFAGDAKMHQAFAADSVDIGVGGAPGLAFVAKGAPEIAVAAVVDQPLDVAIIVSYDSSIHSLDDLKGRKLGISTPGSLTYWLAAELNRVKGWGDQGVTPISIGDFSGRIAALRTGQLDATYASTGLGFQLEDQKRGRLLAPVSSYVGDFITSAIFASNRLVETNPTAVRQFLASWFDAVAFMRSHKAETIAVVRKASGLDDAAQAREYDVAIPMFSTDGKFKPKPLAVLERSLIDLKLVDEKPNFASLYTEKFLER